MAWGLALVLAGGVDAVDLVWAAPEGCPRRAEVADAIARRVQHPAAGARADVLVGAGPGGSYIVEVKASTDHGRMHRRQSVASCRAAADLAAFLIASFVDPVAGVNAAPDPLAPIEPPPAAAAGRPAPTLAGFVRLSGTASFGVLPRWGGGPGLAGGIDVARARVEARTFLDAPQTALVEGTAASARFVAWTGAVLGCFVPGRGALTVPLCLGPELGWVRGQADGFADGRTAHRLVVNVLGSVALSYAPGPWLALRAEADGLVVLTPGRFVVEDVGSLHKIRAGALRLGVGVELRLPSRPIRSAAR